MFKRLSRDEQRAILPWQRLLTCMLVHISLRALNLKGNCIASTVRHFDGPRRKSPLAFNVFCAWVLMTILNCPIAVLAEASDQRTVTGILVEHTNQYFASNGLLNPTQVRGFSFSDGSSTISWAGTAVSTLYKLSEPRYNGTSIAFELTPSLDPLEFELWLNSVVRFDQEYFDIRLGFQLERLTLEAEIGASSGTINGVFVLTRDEPVSPHFRPVLHAAVPVGSHVAADFRLDLQDGAVFGTHLFDHNFRARVTGRVDTSVAVPEPSGLVLWLACGGFLALRSFRGRARFP